MSQKLSVIVPTYNEAGNMPILIPALEEHLKQASIPYEILVMDDNSPDHTADAVKALQKKGHNCRVVVRTTNRGLSPAVVDGYKQATGDVLLVMDADLSHPVEVVPQLYNAIVRKGADVAVGSRHCKGGGIDQWPLKRRLMSWGAATLARPFTTCSDPMSGFFAVKRSVIRNAPLSAQGFKILLEVLVKGKYSKLVEVPIIFKDREIGESKLGNGIIVSYVLHLIRLFFYPGSAPLFKFLFVGGFGAIIDISTFTALMHMAAVSQLTAQFISFSIAVTWNFTWNRIWTFGGGNRKKGGAGGQFVRFAVIACIALAVRSGLFRLGQSALGEIVRGPPGAQALLFAVILVVTIINFIGAKLWAFA